MWEVGVIVPTVDGYTDGTKLIIDLLELPDNRPTFAEL